MIDKTPPIIISYNATAQNAINTEWLLELTAEDPTSGIALIQFFTDDELVGNITSDPNTFLLEGKTHTTQCIVYDAAGNSQTSDVITAYEYNSWEYDFDIIQTII
jgi:hypothetical protein